MYKFFAYIMAMVALAAFLSGCSGQPAPEQKPSDTDITALIPGSHADYSVLEVEDILQGKDTKQEIAPAILRWLDTVDGGDDPMVAGCHWEYSTPQCTDAGAYFGGDACLNARLLSEYTDTSCHVGTPIDLKTYDCDKVCKQQGFMSGYCKFVANACGDGNPSAECRCTTVIPDP